MRTNNNSNSHGITFVGALQLLLIGLKLAGVIHWHWWQVLLPLAVEAVVIFLLLILFVLTSDQWTV